MSHCIEKPVDKVLSTVCPEWHGLADVVPVINREVLQEQGLFFPINSSETIAGITDSGTPIGVLWNNLKDVLEKGELSNAQGLVREFDLISVGSHKTLMADYRGIRPDLETPENGNGLVPLHLPRNSYEVISNSRVFETIEKAFDGCPITSAGTLNSGQVFFLSLQIDQAERKGPRGDVYSQNLCALTSHNGTLGTQFYDSSVRIVCMNTVRASLSNKGIMNFKVYHTKNAEQELNKVSSDLEAVMAERNRFFSCLDELDAISCDVERSRKLFIGYNIQRNEQDNVAIDETDVISTQVYNRAEEIGQLFVRGNGNRGATMYDAWNGLTDCFTNGIGAGKTASKDKKALAGMFGTAADFKEGYLPFLLQSPDILAGYEDRAGRALADYVTAKAR